MLDKYLESIQSPDESLFPMDSVHTGKKRKIVYGEKTDIPEERKRLMIDFDGVIHKYTGFNGGKLNQEVIPGAKKAIEKKKKKYEIVIFTTRASVSANGPEKTKMFVDDIKKWLKEFGIYYDKITSEKLGAIAYIDDRGLRFTGDWDSTIKSLQQIELSESQNTTKLNKK